MSSRFSSQPDQADSSETSAYVVSPAVRECFSRMRTEPAVDQGIAFIEADDERRIAEQIEISEIPAPPFEEKDRADDYARRLAGVGLSDVHIDGVGNAVGILKGDAGRPKLVVSAHLDTVFPRGYDATVTRDEKGILHGPGIADDGAGLAALLSGGLSGL